MLAVPPLDDLARDPGRAEKLERETVLALLAGVRVVEGALVVRLLALATDPVAAPEPQEPGAEWLSAQRVEAMFSLNISVQKAPNLRCLASYLKSESTTTFPSGFFQRPSR